MRLSDETKVGILTAVAITILVIGYNYLRGKEIFTNTKEFYAEYSQTDGVQVSDQVMVNGYMVGRVSDMQLSNHGTIIMELSIREEVFIPKDTKARIRSVDLLGAKVIELILSKSNTAAEDGDTLLTEIEPGWSETINAQVEPLKFKTEQVLNAFDSLLATFQTFLNPQARRDLQQSLDHLNSSMAGISRITEKVESIATNLDNNNERISSILKNVDAISDSLRRVKFVQTIDNTNRVLKDLDILTQKINKGEGSLGMLVNDERLYHRLDSAALNLDKLMIDLRQNPRRYVHFSVFNRKEE